MPFFSKKPKTVRIVMQLFFKINVCVSTLEAELDFAVKSTTNGKRLLDNVNYLVSKLLCDN